jgi:hypothetical protein
MSEFRTSGGQPRPPTWAERERAAQLRAEGIDDVLLDPNAAPPEFWVAVLEAIYHAALRREASEAWKDWEREVRYATGRTFSTNGVNLFEAIVRDGDLPAIPLSRRATLGERLAAIEHLIDIVDVDFTFADLVNDRARFFRVGLQLEGNRFIPVTSELLHTDVVQPTLLLLADARYEEVDNLYRKAFERNLSGDPSGAITAATSSVEELLRILMPDMKGQTLGPLAEKARADGIITPSVEQFIKKLYGLRPDSDAHAGGTSDFDLAMLALHLSGSILQYLGKTGK